MHKVIHQDALTEHKGSLRALAAATFQDELKDPALLSKPFPLFKWMFSKKAPGALFLYLLADPSERRKTIHFFEEMITYHLIPQTPLDLLSSRNAIIDVLNTQKLFIELLVCIENPKLATTAETHLPVLGQEIVLGLQSAGLEKHILEMKHLSLSQRSSLIYEMIMHLTKRFPKRFNKELFRHYQHFIGHCGEGFVEIRHTRHVSRVITSHFYFGQKIEHSLKGEPRKRHLYIKFLHTHLHYPFGIKKVLGVSFSFNTMQDYENFEQKHVLSAIKRILPGVTTHRDSYYTSKSEKNPIIHFYLEIEKEDGLFFSKDEIRALQKQLPREIQNGIEYLSPSVFIPRNEEELIRNIISLSNEFKFVRDLPHAFISFQEQRSNTLLFNVILVRILKKTSVPLTELAEKLPRHVRFFQERVADVGRLRNKYVKEANVFSIELKTHQFLRKNHSVDLVKARQLLVKLVEQLVGSFRDYNGGFLLKQNEQLSTITKLLGKPASTHSMLIEHLFYALTPSVMQTSLSETQGVLLLQLFIRQIEKKLSAKALYEIESDCSEDACAILIKTHTRELKDIFTNTISPKKSEALHVAWSTIQDGGSHYLAAIFLHRPKEEVEAFCSQFEQNVHSWQQEQSSMQTLRLHLPRAAHSLDPRIGADRTSGAVIKMLYEGLMRVTQNNQVEKAIAKSVEISKDRCSYLFKLKHTRWSNGTPVNAYDFEYSWKKVIAPDFHSPYAFLFFPIKNAEAAKRGEVPLNQVGVHAINNDTLSVELEYPAPYFLELTANWVYSPLCKEHDQKHPGWAYHSGESYICNGPFKLDAWKLNDELQLIKNPNYWDLDSVKLGRIHISVIEDEKTAYQLFAEGKLDWVGDPLSKVPPTAIQEAKTAPIGGLFWLQLNLNRAPFNQLKIRQAFAMAIDREKVLQKAGLHQDSPAFGLFKESNTLDFNRDRAISLFTEALSEAGLTLEDFPPLVMHHSDIEEQEIITNEVGLQWQEVFGIKTKYKRLPWYEYSQSLFRGEPTVGGLVWYPRITDPIYFFDILVYREYTLKACNWKNAHYAQLVEQAKQELDEKKRLCLLKQAESVFFKEMPVIPLFWEHFHYLQSPNLTGLILSNTNQIDFRPAFFKGHKDEKIRS